MYVSVLYNPDVRICSVLLDLSNLNLPVLIVGVIAFLLITIILIKRRQGIVNND